MLVQQMAQAINLQCKNNHQGNWIENDEHGNSNDSCQQLPSGPKKWEHPAFCLFITIYCLSLQMVLI